MDGAATVRFLCLLAGLLVVAGACARTPATATATPALGDACLIGTWTLQHETNASGYSFAGTPVAVSGLAGARLTYAAGGSEMETFDGSAPLVGTMAGGRVLSITITGSLTYDVHADGHAYTETGSKVLLPTVATIDGAPIAGYQSYYTAGQGTYVCSTQSLTTTTQSGVQTDTWSR
jgi:hypothetical protein